MGGDMDMVFEAYCRHDETSESAANELDKLLTW